MSEQTKQNKQIKEFVDMYVDKKYKVDWNVIKLSKANGQAHNQMVATICVWCIHNDIQFATECHLVGNYRPDVIVPFGLPVRIIEVRNSETERRTQEKMGRIPKDLQVQIAYVNANQPFNEKSIQ